MDHGPLHEDGNHDGPDRAALPQGPGRTGPLKSATHARPPRIASCGARVGGFLRAGEVVLPGPPHFWDGWRDLRLPPSLLPPVDPAPKRLSAHTR